MAISLRVVVIMLVIVVGVAATLIALLPVREAGLKAVRKTAALLRLEIADRLAGDLLGYFQAPMYAIAALRDQHRVGLINSTGNLLNLVPSIASTSQRLGLPVYVANPADEICYVEGSGTVLWYGGVHNSSTTEWWEWDGEVSTTDFSWNRTTTGFLSDYRPSQRPWYDSVAANQSWGPVYVEHLSTSITTVSPGGPMNNPTTGALEGVAVVDVRNDFLLDYFSTVVIAKRGRAMLLHTKSRACLGGNWNESAVIPINGSWEDSRLASVHDLHEPLFAKTVSVLGEDGLFNTSLPYRTEFGTGKDAVYVDIVQIADSYGLDLRLLVMIPEKDFLEEVDEQVNIVIGAVCGAVVALLLIAFIITAAVLHPLTTLETRMYCAATFQDTVEDDSGSSSLISEVANIQTAFAAMSKELKRVKSYLPRSMLAILENADEELDEEMTLLAQTEKASTGKAGSAATGKGGRPDDVATNQSINSLSRSEMNSVRSSRAGGASIAQSFAAAKIARGLFVEDTTASKKITVVFVNILGTHKAMKENWRNMKQQQVVLLEALQIHSKKFKGVVDSFQGDHVIVTFNAVLAVASHQSKAAHFAITMMQEFADGLITDAEMAASGMAGSARYAAPETQPASSSTPDAMGGGEANTVINTNPLTIGVACGDCLIGNMGIEGFKRFNIVGAAFTNAMILERLCKQFKVPILTNHSTATTMSFDTFVDAIGAFQLPTTAGSKATVLYSVRGSKESGDDEWMYDLKEKEERDMGNVLNSAWVKFVTEGAQDLTSTKEVVTSLIQQCAAKAQEEKTGFSPGQRASLLALADAVNKSGATLDDYLEAQGGKYYSAAFIQGEKK